MGAIIEPLFSYELERGKPVPTLIHRAIQFNIGFELKTKYPDQFRIASEVGHLSHQTRWQPA